MRGNNGGQYRLDGQMRHSLDEFSLHVQEEPFFVPLAEHLHQPSPPQNLGRATCSGPAEALQNARQGRQGKTDRQEQRVEEREPADVSPQEPQGSAIIEVLGNQFSERENKRGDQKRGNNLGRHPLGKAGLDGRNAHGDGENVMSAVTTKLVGFWQNQRMRLATGSPLWASIPTRR